MSKDFQISVVLPIYNAEKYLDETLSSLVNQTIGIQDMQIILVDDGSSDSSLEICQAFKDAHPDNTVVIHQENAGVSAARNAGLDVVQGEYVAFLDSDDLWSESSFENALRFFEDNDVSLLVAKLSLFERSSWHPLGYRFNNEHIIDLDLAQCSVQPTIGNCIFRSEAIANIRFDTDLSTSEDTLFIARALLSDPRYGVSPKCEYFYRKRDDESSLSQQNTMAKNLQNLEVCKRMFAASKEARGRILPFIQASALYILAWEVFGKLTEECSEDAAQQWLQDVAVVLDDISMRLIRQAGWLSRPKRVYMLQTKYGNDFFAANGWKNQEDFYYDDIKVFFMNNSTAFNVYEIKETHGKLHLSGTTDVNILRLPYKLIAENQHGEVFEAEILPYPRRDLINLINETVYEGLRFNLDLPAVDGVTYTFYAILGNNPEHKLILTPHYGNFARLSTKDSWSYCVLKNYLAVYTNRQITLHKKSAKRHLKYELKRLDGILHNKKFSRHTRWSYVGMRLLYHLHKGLFRKPLWLFVDKEWKAGDNGENVFRYATSQSGRNDIDFLFALEKSSKDYPGVRTYGKVVDPSTRAYKLKFLLSDKLISSRCEVVFLNPYEKRVELIKDLLSHDFIYLTHGTLFGDLSAMLNRTSKKIDIFSVSTQMEFDALQKPEYAYDPENVRLNGMARYDAYDGMTKKKVIAFLPTWRSHLAGSLIPGTSTREYIADFKETDFWQFYNALINDPRLHEAMKKYGYTGEFYVHPAFEKQACDFEGNDLIYVGEGSADYERVLGESMLLVTDFSGVAFDFGYMREPVVYSQYDSVFSTDHSHTYGEENYFDYETQGFGPIAHTVDETVDAIIHYLETDCALEDTYKDRADAMFGHSDFNNCKRIFNAIESLDQNTD